MSDRATASIRIGGNLPASLLAEFIEAIDDEGPDGVYDEDGERYEDTEDAVRACSDDGAVLDVADSQARGAMMENLEAFCTANGLTWVRESDGHYEWDACIAWWTPADGDSRTGWVLHEARAGRYEGAACITIDEIQNALAGELDEGIDALRALIAAHTPPDVPPFRIIEDAQEAA